MTFQQYIQQKNLDISIVDLEDLEISLRIDSDYYRQDFLLSEKLVKNKWDIFTNIDVKIIHPKEFKRVYVENNWYKLVLSQNIKDWILNTDDLILVSEEVKNDIIKNKLYYWDVLLTRTWYLENVSNYLWNEEVYACADILIIRSKLNWLFLWTFFNSSYGKKILERWCYWLAQPHIAPSYLKNVYIPIPSNSFQTQIANLVQESFKQKEFSKKLYLEAEKLLLSELWLSDYIPTEQNISIKDSEEVDIFWRFDAEFFQPKYDEIIYKIQSYKWWYDFVRNLFKQNKDINRLEANKINYIEIWDINISNWEITHNELEKNDLPANAKILLKKDDLLISTVRPYRWAIAIVRNNTKNLVWSWAFTVLREKTFFKKETLQILLKLDIYKELMLRYNCWASYPVIKDEDVLNLPIPKIDVKIQEKIAELVKESHISLDLSKQLLKKAKKSVEIFIEEDENEALEFLIN